MISSKAVYQRLVEKGLLSAELNVVDMSIELKVNDVAKLKVTTLLDETDPLFIDLLSKELKVELQEASKNNCLFVDTLRELFYKKLQAENDMDKAFVKAVWIAYLKGIEVGKASTTA
jgi:hypothetical protein